MDDSPMHYTLRSAEVACKSKPEMGIHSQQNSHNTLHQSHCYTEQSIIRIITKDETGNGQSNTGEPATQKRRNVILSSNHISSELHEISKSPSPLSTIHEDLIELFPQPSITDRKKICSIGQDRRPTPLSGKTTKLYADASSSSEVGCVLPARKDNKLHSPKNKLTSQSDLRVPVTVCGGINSKSVKDNISCKTEHFCAQSGFEHKKLSNVYGGVDTGSLNIIGSWALQNLSGKMQQGDEFEVADDLRQGREQAFHSNNSETSDGRARTAAAQDKANVTTGTTSPRRSQWHFQANAGTSLQIRANHIVKLTCLLVLLIGVFSIVFHSRIRALEDEKTALLRELGTVKMHLQLLVSRMDDVVALAIPPRSQRKHTIAAYKSEQQMGESMDQEIWNENESRFRNDNGLDVNSIPRDKNGGQPGKRIAKRSAAASRTTKELLYSTGTVTANGLNNETSISYGSKMDDWTLRSVEKPKSSQGNPKNKTKFSKKKFIRRLLRKELRKLKHAHRLQKKHLNRKLKQVQQQISSANLSSCNDYYTSQKSHSPAQSACGFKNSRAVYLQIDGSSVNIKKPRQLIGPWYLPNSGDEIGFNNLWYNHLTLDSNGTSVVFQESGLYLISAQVFYQLQHYHNATPKPMGYRIHLKKSTRDVRRPLTIAECVPSFPTTVYQTCFTQVAWYVETQDEMYLEHFTDSLPIIEALTSGQTFLGLVRLN